jgi:hypothetical protein
MKVKKAVRQSFIEYGEFSRQDFCNSCWAFIHELSIDAALKSNSVLVQSLALLDKMGGRRRPNK